MKRVFGLFTAVGIVVLSMVLLGCTSNDQAIEKSKERPGGFLTELQTIHTTIPSSTVSSKDQVKEAILQATKDYDWTLDQEQANTFIFKIFRRKHMVKVKITYTEKEYTIEYADSENMRYDKEHNAIHRNYMRWVNNLDKAIYKSVLSKGGAKK